MPLQVFILKSFKSSVLEMFIPESLPACFWKCGFQRSSEWRTGDRSICRTERGSVGVATPNYTRPERSSNRSRSLHQLELTRFPRLVEPRLERPVKPK